MAKKKSAAAADGELVISEKFRTTPIKSTITHIKGLHSSAILYKCQASSYWQFRAFLEGKRRKCTTKEIEFDRAQRKAKLIYAEWLNSINSGETKTEPTTSKSLDVIARSLWAKNETRIKNGELNKDKNNKDKYVYDRHIKPFFSRYDVKLIDLNLLERFKSHLADQRLSAATQLSYINLVMSLLKEAQIKRLISNIPIKPRVRSEDGVRGFFDDDEFEELRKAITKNIDKKHEFKAEGGETYRTTRITEELGHIIDFMVETYIRPTDLKVIRHSDIRMVEKSGITFLVLEHDKTKLHKKNMVSTERGLYVYSKIIDYRNKIEGMTKADYLFLPSFTNRDTALQNISTQFAAILAITGMSKDRHGKPRTLYSLRHTAIVRSLRKGIPIELVASNARTSTEMIRRFYGVHIDNILETGTVYAEKEIERRNTRDRNFIEMLNELKEVSGDEMWDPATYEKNAAEDLQKRIDQAKPMDEKEKKSAQQLYKRNLIIKKYREYRLRLEQENSTETRNEELEAQYRSLKKIRTVTHKK